ncbi:unnamed protein product [Diamesa hyperborea]
MRNVLQYFWEYETTLSGDRDTCTENCPYYSNVKYSGGDGCYGKARACEFKLSVGDSVFPNLSNDDDRIYEKYALYQKWYGINKTPLGRDEIPKTTTRKYFWEYETALSGDQDTCTENCPYYSNVKFRGGDGCYGKARACEFKLSVGDPVYPNLSNDDDRIYEKYALYNKWYGINKTLLRKFEIPKTTTRKASIKSFYVIYDCHLCRCTCDNYEHSKTMRRFYSAPVRAEKYGYVITGVRFIEVNKIIFLQIQIGKLLAVGMIDAETVHWQEVQADVGDNYIEFNYDLRQFNLKGNVMENEVLTENGGMKLKVFGKEHSNLEGTLNDNEKEYISQNSDVHSIIDKIPKLKEDSKKFTKIIDKAIQFEVSNDDEDAGQSFVPYLDGSDIEFDVKAPLSGIGFMYYTNDDYYAGYIRPYLKSFNYKSFAKTQ